MGLLKPYLIYIKVGVLLALLGYMAYLKIDNLDKDKTLINNKNTITALEQDKANLNARITKMEEEAARIGKIDEKTTEVEIKIEKEYVEVEKDVIIYQESPNAKRCSIDADWVLIYDKAVSIVGLPETELARKIQSSPRTNGETVSLSKEEWKDFSVTLTDALNVTVRNYQRCADTYAKYFGLYEICTGEKLEPSNKGE